MHNTDLSDIFRASGRVDETKKILGLLWEDKGSELIAESLAKVLDPDVVAKCRGGVVEWHAPTFLFQDRGEPCMVGSPDGCFRLVSVRDEEVSVFVPRPRRASLIVEWPLRISWDKRRDICGFYEGIMYDALSGCLIIRGESLSLILVVCYVAKRIATGDMDPRFARDNFLGLFSKIASECAQGKGIVSGLPGPYHVEIASVLGS